MTIRYIVSTNNESRIFDTVDAASKYVEFTYWMADCAKVVKHIVLGIGKYQYVSGDLYINVYPTSIFV